MIDPTQLLKHVIRPVLTDLDLWSGPAERLVLGTACQESACGQYLVQLGNVAAGGLGIYQCEPATHDDLWDNFLDYRLPLAQKVKKYFANVEDEASRELVWNLGYATAICRIHYLRVPTKIPDNLHGQAEYYKKYYNTELGKATVEEYLNNWQRFVPSGLV